MQRRYKGHLKPKFRFYCTQKNICYRIKSAAIYLDNQSCLTVHQPVRPSYHHSVVIVMRRSLSQFAAACAFDDETVVGATCEDGGGDV